MAIKNGTDKCTIDLIMCSLKLKKGPAETGFHWIRNTPLWATKSLPSANSFMHGHRMHCTLQASPYITTYNEWEYYCSCLGHSPWWAVRLYEVQCILCINVSWLFSFPHAKRPVSLLFILVNSCSCADSNLLSLCILLVCFPFHRCVSDCRAFACT